MEIEFCNLSRQYEELKDKIDRNITRVLEHGKYLNGPEIDMLEKRLADFVGAKYAFGVSSGTDALLAALMAYEIEYGDYVLTTPFTFIASASTIAMLGAKPLFVDIDERTYNIDVEKLKRVLINPFNPKTGERIQNDKIKGVIAVDLYGQSADYDKIREAVGDRFIIEDGAQSFGGEYKGRKTCALGDISITSFFPSKPLGCYGDGGMIFTDDKRLAKKIKMIRNHGQSERYEHKILGLNFRMSSLQAAILLAKFESFDNDIKKRLRAVEMYNEGLGGAGLVLPFVEEFNKPVFAQYSIIAEKRDELRDFLNKEGVPTAVHYPKPAHLQEVFSELGYKEGNFPVAEKVSKSIISLPICSNKTEEEIDFVCEKVRLFYGG